MILASLLSLVLSLSSQVGTAPLNLVGTLRLNQPVLGEVCLQAVGVSDDAEILYRESCEGLDGSIRQIRWHWPWAGEYRIRATYRGGTETISTPYQTLVVKKQGPW